MAASLTCWLREFRFEFKMGFRLDVFTFPPVLAFLGSLALAGLALYQNRKPIHLLFALWNILVAAWCAVSFFLYTAFSADQAAARTLYLRDIFLFIHPVFYQFVSEFLRERSKSSRRFLYVIYGFSVLFVICNHLPGHFVVDMRKDFWGFTPVAAPMAKIYALVFQVTVWSAIYKLFQAQKKASGMLRNQCRFLLWASIMMFGGAVSNFMVVLGVAVYPFGNVFTILSSLLVAYAVISIGFLEFRMLVGQSFAYGALACTVTGIYWAVEHLLKRILFEDKSSPDYLVQMAAVPLTLAAAVKMRHLVKPLLHMVPVWRRYNTSQMIQDFQENVLTHVDLSALSRSVVMHLEQVFDAQEVALFLREEGVGDYVFSASTQASVWPNFSPEDGIVGLLRQRWKPVLREQWLWQHLQGDALGTVPRLLLAQIQSSSWAVLLPLMFRQELVGIIALKEKKNEDMYHAEDVRQFNALSGLVAMALSNALALKRLTVQQKKLDQHRQSVLMGTLATEMAHELAKPLTHIINEGVRLEKYPLRTHMDSVARIEKEARRASLIMNSFAELSSRRSLVSEAVDLSDLMDNVLHSLGISEDPAYHVIKRYQALPLVNVHPVQMEQILNNVLQNAIQAMPDGGTLTLTLCSMADKCGFRIEIVDTGKGIPSDVLPHVFDPFVTTKTAHGGRGVGLTIVRAMVERHGGTICLESPVTKGQGTKVVLDMPWSPKENTAIEN